MWSSTRAPDPATSGSSSSRFSPAWSVRSPNGATVGGASSYPTATPAGSKPPPPSWFATPRKTMPCCARRLGGLLLDPLHQGIDDRRIESVPTLAGEEAFFLIFALVEPVVGPRKPQELRLTRSTLVDRRRDELGIRLGGLE